LCAFSYPIRQERLEDDLSGDSNSRTIWTHPRGMVSGLNDYLDTADNSMHNKQARHPPIQHHRTPPLPQQQVSRDPNNYYEDFDNVAYSTANQLLNEDNLNNMGRSIWNDRGTYTFHSHLLLFFTHTYHITTRTPISLTPSSSLRHPCTTTNAQTRAQPLTPHHRAYPYGSLTLRPHGLAQ
jgi:hypothetical protein